MEACDGSQHLGRLQCMFIATVESFDLRILNPESVVIIRCAPAECGNRNAPGIHTRQDGVEVFAHRGELQFAFRRGFGPLFQELTGIFFHQGSQGVIISSTENEDGSAFRRDWFLTGEKFFELAQLATGQRLFRGEDGCRVAIASW